MLLSLNIFFYRERRDIYIYISYFVSYIIEKLCILNLVWFGLVCMYLIKQPYMHVPRINIYVRRVLEIISIFFSLSYLHFSDSKESNYIYPQLETETFIFKTVRVQTSVSSCSLFKLVVMN